MQQVDCRQILFILVRVILKFINNNNNNNILLTQTFKQQCNVVCVCLYLQDDYLFVQAGVVCGVRGAKFSYILTLSSSDPQRALPPI